jgi:hypothetical protein
MDEAGLPGEASVRKKDVAVHVRYESREGGGGFGGSSVLGLNRARMPKVGKGIKKDIDSCCVIFSPPRKEVWV